MTLYTPLFRSCNTLKHLTQLHAHLLVSGFHDDPRASTKLIDAYAQQGSIHSSKFVFETFKTPDSFMWAVLIKCHVRMHLFPDAISLYNTMLFNQVQVTDFIYPSVLIACGGFGDVGIGRKVHGRILKCGFDSDSVVKTSLLGMYGELGCLVDSKKVFDDMSVRDLVSWSSIISCCINNGEAFEGLEMFKLSVSEGVNVDSVTMLCAAEACGELGALRLGKSVHGYAVRRKIENFESLSNFLVVMYSKCGDLSSAERIFVNVANWSTSSATAMISCYNRSGSFQEALEVFNEMLDSSVETNVITLPSVLRSCAGLKWLRGGKSVHCYLYKKDIDLDDEFVAPALIELYAACGKINYCKKVLHSIGERNIVSWNILMSIYAHEGMLREAVELFRQMHQQGLMLDSFSLSSSLSACGTVGLLHLGHQIHGQIVKRCILNEFVQNALISMYSKCGMADLAYLVFDDFQLKSVITWNSMVCGFSQNGKSQEAINLFDRMHLNGMEMNEVTFLTAMQACSQLGHLGKGKWLHHKLITSGIKKDLYIDTALTDMYAKCGDLKTALRFFDSMPERSVVTWSVMIAGYGMHGDINAAVSLFNQMIDLGIKPNEITFMSILSACSHSGCVEEGKSYFKSMSDFGVEPNSEHFACMVDLLSRAGDITEAYRILNSMPFPADASIWAALLNGCRIHQRMDMIESIKRDLVDVRTDDTGYYTLLSNIFAEEGMWVESRKVRSVMEGRGLKKVPGYSTIEIDKRTYKFGSGDTSHRNVQEICSFLENFHSLAEDVENYFFADDYCVIPKGRTVVNNSKNLAIVNGIMRSCSEELYSCL